MSDSIPLLTHPAQPPSPPHNYFISNGHQSHAPLNTRNTLYSPPSPQPYPHPQPLTLLQHSFPVQSHNPSQNIRPIYLSTCRRICNKLNPHNPPTAFQRTPHKPVKILPSRSQPAHANPQDGITPRGWNMTMWHASQASMVELSLTLETSTRRAYEFMVTTPREVHPRGTEALRGPCAYARRIVVSVDEQYLILHLVQGGRSRHHVVVRMSEVLKAWREDRSMKVAVSIFTVSMFVDGYEREGASLIGRFRFVSMMIRNSWRMIGPGVEGVVYVKRADGGWKCVYRKGRCESGGEVLLYGNQAIKGIEVRVEGVAIKNGEVLFGGGGVLTVEEGSGVGWWGGGGRVDRVEGKGVVEVDLELIVEGGGWWRRRWKKEEKIGLLQTA